MCTVCAGHTVHMGVTMDTSLAQLYGAVSCDTDAGFNFSVFWGGVTGFLCL